MSVSICATTKQKTTGQQLLYGSFETALQIKTE